jgi:hypothetical protein
MMEKPKYIPGWALKTLMHDKCPSLDVASLFWTRRMKIFKPVEYLAQRRPAAWVWAK